MKTRKHFNKSQVSPTVSIEKVDLSHLRAFKVKSRPEQEAQSRMERSLAWEVRTMFKHLSYDTMINERRDLRYLSIPPTKEQIVPVKKKVVFATSYDVVHDVVLGTYRKGKNFVKRKVDALEIVQVIDWDSFAK